jgi:Rad52/22 family double-strand break repair protein
MNPEVREILARLVQPFPSRFVKQPPQGKHGSYVPHDIVNQRALAIVGPHGWRVVETIRGWTDEVVVNRGKPNEKVYAARDDAVVGVLGELTINLPEGVVIIQEPGDAEGAAAQSDGQNAKEAASDAYKRCWMRTGLGLHLWSQGDYELPKMLDHYQPVVEVEGQERLAV